MSQQQLSHSSESQEILQRLNKKLKRQDLNVNIAANADINQVALQKYQQVKKSYNFVPFQEADKSKTVTVGSYDQYIMPIHDFNQQMYKFRKNGYCTNPNVQMKSLIFNNKHKELKDKTQLQGQQINQKHEQFMQKLYKENTKEYRKQITKQFKQARQQNTNFGPWAGYGQNLENGALTQQQKETLLKAQQNKNQKIQQAKKQQENFEPYSVFHWKQQYDYKGLSYVDPPSDLKTTISNCFIPKKQIQTWVSSQKAGFQVLRFFPKSGHFLLVGNPQGKVHLFDIIRNRTCAHTYIGHTKAVRDIQFANDGKHFLSCGFDGQVHYWDTEYGKGHYLSYLVLRTFKLKKIPFCMKFHPSSQRQNSFLVGSSNKKILQFDLNTGTKQFEYNAHLGTVNTITFIQQNKFVTSSDDKKLFVWQYGIPVVTKHVSEPQMHTITATALHPGGQYFAGQSSDNQIVIYQNKGGNFRRIRSKKFASHSCAGYACSIDFSNDGQFLISGDERGRIYFYDWKTSKNYRTLQAHPSVCIGVQWHPNDSNMVASCGWEGLVKLWQ